MRISICRGPWIWCGRPRTITICTTFPDLNVADFDRAVYKALKPGGIFLVLDHVAPAGSGFSDTSTLHRIDPEAAKKEIMSAGFQFVGESNVLHNPNDSHTLKVFDPSIRGRTDQLNNMM